MRNLWKNNYAQMKLGGNILGGSMRSLLIIAAVFLIIVIIFLIVVVSIGIFVFIGICLIGAAVFLVFIKRGKIQIAWLSPFSWCFFLGIILIITGGVFRLEIAYLDFSFLQTLPGINELRTFMINQMVNTIH